MKKIEDMYKMIYFDDMGDERGQLTVAEGNSDKVPFEIKRVFYIYGSDSTVKRGQHANIRTQFLMINVSGSSKVKVDNGIETRIVELNGPNVGLFLDRMVWKDMYDFSPDSVLLVLASEHYDASEYIRDYDTYKQMLKVDLETN